MRKGVDGRVRPGHDVLLPTAEPWLQNILEFTSPPCDKLMMDTSSTLFALSLHAELLLLCARIGFSPPQI
jgi:hypothetical protein